jgi:hypothetical protein
MSFTNSAFLLPIIARPMSDAPIELLRTFEQAILRMLNRADLSRIESISSTRNAPWHVGYVLYEL